MFCENDVWSVVYLKKITRDLQFLKIKVCPCLAMFCIWKHCKFTQNITSCKGEIVGDNFCENNPLYILKINSRRHLKNHKSVTGTWKSPYNIVFNPWIVFMWKSVKDILFRNPPKGLIKKTQYTHNHLKIFLSFQTFYWFSYK